MANNRVDKDKGYTHTYMYTGTLNGKFSYDEFVFYFWQHGSKRRGHAQKGEPRESPHSNMVYLETKQRETKSLNHDHRPEATKEGRNLKG